MARLTIVERRLAVSCHVAKAGIPRTVVLCHIGRRLVFCDGIRWHSTGLGFVPTARKARIAGEMVAHAAIAAEIQRAARLVFVGIMYFGLNDEFYRC